MGSGKQPRIGIGVMLLRDGKVLLGRRHEDPEKADSELRGEGTWTMPGGKLDFMETPEECARRELLEETGIKAKKMEFFSATNDVAGDAHFITLGFLCTGFEGEPRAMEPDEITEWKWFPLNSLPENMFFPSAKMAKNYMEKKSYRE